MCSAYVQANLKAYLSSGTSCHLIPEGEGSSPLLLGEGAPKGRVRVTTDKLAHYRKSA